MIIISPVVRLILKIATLLIYLLTLACAFGGYVPPQITSIPAIMVLALPYMAILSALLVIIWAATRHWWIAGAGVLMFVACWTPVSMQFPFHTADKPTEGADTFRLLTWNVAHGEDFTRTEADDNRTFRAILHQNADIVCLQEMIVFKPGRVPKLSQQLYDSICTLYPYRETWESYDLQIWSKYPFSGAWQIPECAYSDARIARFNIKGHEFFVCNVHLTSYALEEDDQKIISNMRSPGSIKHNIGLFKNSVYQKLKASFPIRATVTEGLIRSINQYSGPTVVCGDFNDVPASWTYRLFLKDGFKDAYTATNFFCTDTFNRNLLLFHIDQILYRGDIKPLSVERIPLKTSDHYGLVAEFEFIEKNH